MRCQWCSHTTEEGHSADCLGTNLRTILGFTTVGWETRRRIDLAAERVTEWQALLMPLRDEIRGGSSSPGEIRERDEDRQVSVQAVRDEHTFRRLLPAFVDDLNGGVSESLKKNARILAKIVARYSVPVDHELLNEGPPGCKSCARTSAKKQLTGHFEPVADRYTRLQLCRWCGEFQAANGSWPPIEAVDVRARLGTKAAGHWLARNGIHTRKRKRR